MTRELPVVTKDDGVQQPKQGRADLNGTAFVKKLSTTKQHRDP